MQTEDQVSFYFVAVYATAQTAREQATFVYNTVKFSTASITSYFKEFRKQLARSDLYIDYGLYDNLQLKLTTLFEVRKRKRKPRTKNDRPLSVLNEVRRMNREPHFCGISEFNRAEVRLMNRAL